MWMEALGGDRLSGWMSGSLFIVSGLWVGSVRRGAEWVKVKGEIEEAMCTNPSEQPPQGAVRGAPRPGRAWFQFLFLTHTAVAHCSNRV
jgi:hypothetical protein